VSVIMTLEGLVALNKYATGNATPNWQIGLYNGAVGPGDSTVLSSFPPATFGGYAAQAAPFSSAVADSGADQGTSSMSAVTFTADGTSAEDVYGWYLWDATLGVSICAEEFGTPLHLANLGDSITVQLNYETGDL
jgi:hypothetical protein